jgi:cytochrome P450
LPHATQEEDSWNGYYIPKGTIVNFNIGFMMKDPRVWGEDGHEFKPERFLSEDAKSFPDVLSLVFGFGKRYVPCLLASLFSVLYCGTSCTEIYNLEFALGDI